MGNDILEQGSIELPKSNNLYSQKIQDVIDDVSNKVIELIDIIDKELYLKNGQIKVIKSISKSEAHETGEFHQAGHVWIYNSKQELLLQKRSKNKDSFPGLWDISSAGHISAGESAEEGTLRELSEELGLKIDKKELEEIFTHEMTLDKIMRGKEWHNNELNKVYLLKYEGKVEDLKMQLEEVEELKFVPIEQYKKEIQDPKLSKEYVLQRPEYYKNLFSAIEEKFKK